MRFQEKARSVWSELASTVFKPNVGKLTRSIRLYMRKVLEIVVSRKERKGYALQMVWVLSYINSLHC